MFFGRKDKRRPNQRVEDLKARVEALRQADEAAGVKPYSLDSFLGGDDVLTGRETEEASEGGAEPEMAVADYEALLAAELERYLRREQERENLARGGYAQPAPQQEPASNDKVGPGADGAAEPVAGVDAPRGRFEDWPPEEDWPPQPRSG